MYKFIAILGFISFSFSSFSQTQFEYPENLKSDTLYVPLLDLLTVPKQTPVTPQQKREFDKTLRKNRQIQRANAKITSILETNYPFVFKTITISEIEALDKDAYVLESFSQLTRKMAYYYKEHIDLLEELMDESESRPHHFKDVFLYYYITTNQSDKEFIVVDFGKKNIPSALRYFCKSVNAYYEQ